MIGSWTMIEDSGGQSQRTSLTLLEGMLNGDERQWDRFVKLYGPLVYEWCRRARVSEDESADVVQDVFRAVATKLKDFRREGPGDSFHGWLWGITRNTALYHFRRAARQPTGRGGSAAQSQLNEIPEVLPETWNDAQQQSDTSLVYQRAVELLQTEFESHTWQAFWQTVVEGDRAGDVAAKLGMTVGAVYNARYKVLKRLRTEFAGMFKIEDALAAE